MCLRRVGTVQGTPLSHQVYPHFPDKETWTQTGKVLVQGHTSRNCSHQCLNPGPAASRACSVLAGGPGSRAVWWTVSEEMDHFPPIHCGQILL